MTILLFVPCHSNNTAVEDVDDAVAGHPTEFILFVVVALSLSPPKLASAT